jgi:hypothetical protein
MNPARNIMDRHEFRLPGLGGKDPASAHRAAIGTRILIFNDIFSY